MMYGPTAKAMLRECMSREEWDVDLDAASEKTLDELWEFFYGYMPVPE